MKKVYFLDIDESDNRIINASNLPQAGWEQVLLDRLPVNILNQCYELLSDGTLLYHAEWDETNLIYQLQQRDDAIQALKEELATSKQAMEEEKAVTTQAILAVMEKVSEKEAT